MSSRDATRRAFDKIGETCPTVDSICARTQEMLDDYVAPNNLSAVYEILDNAFEDVKKGATYPFRQALEESCENEIELENQVDELEAEIERLKREIDDRDSTIQDKDSEINDHLASISDLEDDIIDKDKLISELEKNI